MHFIVELLKIGYKFMGIAAFMGKKLIRLLLQLELHDWLAFGMGVVAVLSLLWELLRRVLKLRKLLAKCARRGKKKKQLPAAWF